MGEFTEFLTEAATDIQDFLAVLHALKNLGVVGLIAHIEIEEAEHAYAWVRENFPGFVPHFQKMSINLLRGYVAVFFQQLSSLWRCVLDVLAVPWYIFAPVTDLGVLILLLIFGHSEVPGLQCNRGGLGLMICA